MESELTITVGYLTEPPVMHYERRLARVGCGGHANPRFMVWGKRWLARVWCGGHALRKAANPRLACSEGRSLLLPQRRVQWERRTVCTGMPPIMLEFLENATDQTPDVSDYDSLRLQTTHSDSRRLTQTPTRHLTVSECFQTTSKCR